MQRKDFIDDKLTIFSYGKPKGKNTDKGYRARMVLETSNTLQRKPQLAELNMRYKLLIHPPRPVFIYHVGTSRFISRQSALIAWHNAFKITCMYMFVPVAN